MINKRFFIVVLLIGITIIGGVHAQAPGNVAVDDVVSDWQVYLPLIIKNYDASQLADIIITKRGPATAAPGAVITYTIAYTNAGPAAALAVVITDTMPHSATYQAASVSPFSTAPLAWRVSELPAHDGGTIIISASVDAETPEGAVLTNTVTIDTTTPDSASRNNHAAVTTTVWLTPRADLAIVKIAPLTTTPGAHITYTIVYSNAGAANAADVHITDTLPPSVTYRAASVTPIITAPVVWALGDLPAGGEGVITLIGAVDTAAADSTTLFNTVEATIAAPDSDSANNHDVATTTVQKSISPYANIAITKTAPLTTAPGALITYTITYTNAGAVFAPLF